MILCVCSEVRFYLSFIHDLENDLDFDIKRTFQNLIQLPKEGWDTDSDDLYKMICCYLAKFFYRQYEMRYINLWVEKNQGRSFLDLVTASNVAYVNMIIEGNREVWDQAINISELDAEERAKYRPKNRKKLPAEEQESYMRKQGKFANKKGHKARYCEDNTTKEGKLFYKGQLEVWKLLFRNGDKMDRLQVVWEEYVQEYGFGHHWRASGFELEDDQGNSEEEEDVDLPFSLPGDDDFEEERPWRSQYVRGGDDAEEDDESEGGDGVEIDAEKTDFSYDDINALERAKKKRKPARVSDHGTEKSDDYSGDESGGEADEKGVTPKKRDRYRDELPKTKKWKTKQRKCRK